MKIASLIHVGKRSVPNSSRFEPKTNGWSIHTFDSLSQFKGFNCVLLLIVSFGCIGCGRSESTDSKDSDSDSLTSVTLQLDWYPEAAHGGFFQAKHYGFYEQAGLEVEIRSGGPGTDSLREVSLSNAEFSISRVDEIVIAAERGLPLVIAGIYNHHDPQGIMLHASDPAHTFEDLNGRNVMIEPGSSHLGWIEFHYGLRLKVLPLDYGIDRFLQDSRFIQQCFVTSQPFYARKNGAEVRTLLISDSGFDPGRCIYSSKVFALKEPDLVQRFVAASMEGWKAYLQGDRSKTDARLIELNPQNSEDLIDFSVSEMNRLNIVEGRPELDLPFGQLSEDRLAETIQALRKTGLISNQIKPSQLLHNSVQSSLE